MFAVFHTPADLTFQGFSPKSLLDRILAALAAAEARAQTRRDYRRMLASDDLLEDVGVTRAEVRRALGAVDTYRVHRTIAAMVTTARKFLAVFSYRVATRRNCLSFEKQHSIRDRIA